MAPKSGINMLRVWFFPIIFLSHLLFYLHFTLADPPTSLKGNSENDARLNRVWQDIQKAQNKYSSASGTVTETRTSPLLIKPIIFRGKFYAKGLGKFYLEYTEPETVRIVFNEDYLNVTTGKKITTTEVLKVGDNVRRTQEYFSRENSISNLRKNFTITVTENESTFDLRLVPRAGRFAKKINYFVVKLNKDNFLLRALEIDGKNGVNSLFDLKINELNPNLDDALFKTYPIAR